MKKFIWFFSLIFLFFIACGDGTPNGGNIYDDDDPKDPGQPVETKAKPKLLWFDAEANFQLFSKKENVVAYLDLAKKVGFNQIVLDVRPLQGDAMYKSKIVPEVKTIHGVTINRDWDYLQFFIEEVHKRDMKIIASATVFSGGSLQDKNGMVFRSNEWDDKVAVMYMPDGTLVSSKNNPSKTEAAVFMNPAIPEVQNYALSIIEEVVTKYDVDGFALDYCRYSDYKDDFSDYSRQAFSQYIKESVNSFPSDIFTYNANGSRNPGKYYKQWWEFRSMTITNFIAKARQKIKSIKPKAELHLWAASWHGNRYEVGQNWASKNYNNFPSSWATENYHNTGFAEQLDVFQLGTYLNTVWGLNNSESIEYGIWNGKQIVKGACTMYGTIFANNHKDDKTANSIEEAVYVCLRDSEGLMVFDIVQVIGFDLWNGIKRGIDRAEAKK